MEDEEGIIRKGTVLEDWMETLLRRAGFETTQHMMLHGHEIDVWGERQDGKSIAVECKEYYEGKVSMDDVRNFFAKIYDLRNLIGKPDNAILVSSGVLTLNAQDFADRNGITIFEREDIRKFEEYVDSFEDAIKKKAIKKDKLLIDLQEENRKLRKEIQRRERIKKLSSKIENLNFELQIETLPPFLQPSAFANYFRYSKSKNIAFVGLKGEFRDFISIDFVNIDAIKYESRGLFFKGTHLIPAINLKMEYGSIELNPEIGEYKGERFVELKEMSLTRFLKKPVYTVDKKKLLGQTSDFVIGIEDNKLKILAVEIIFISEIQQKFKKTSALIPRNRIVFRNDEFIVLAKYKE